MNNIPVITVDGPVGAGKGTIAQAVAKKLDWHLLDSGAIYRILALSVLQNQIAPNDETTVTALADNLNIEFKLAPKDNAPCQVILEKQDVTDQIRTENVGKIASIIAAHSRVRQALLKLQRAFRKPPGLIADGRDMGTIVFPDAPLKIFLTASVTERAKRRHQQLLDKGISVKLPNLVQEITERDARDEQRAVSPLKPAPDAIIIDTTNLTITEVIEKILGLKSSCQTPHCCV